MKKLIIIIALFCFSCSPKTMPTLETEKAKIEKKQDLAFKVKVILVILAGIYAVNALADDTVRK